MTKPYLFFRPIFETQNLVGYNILSMPTQKITFSQFYNFLILKHSKPRLLSWRILNSMPPNIMSRCLRSILCNIGINLHVIVTSFILFLAMTLILNLEICFYQNFREPFVKFSIGFVRANILSYSSSRHVYCYIKHLILENLMWCFL